MTSKWNFGWLAAVSSQRSIGPSPIRGLMSRRIAKKSEMICRAASIHHRLYSRKRNLLWQKKPEENLDLISDTCLSPSRIPNRSCTGISKVRATHFIRQDLDLASQELSILMTIAKFACLRVVDSEYCIEDIGEAKLGRLQGARGSSPCSLGDHSGIPT